LGKTSRCRGFDLRSRIRRCCRAGRRLATRSDSPKLVTIVRRYVEGGEMAGAGEIDEEKSRRDVLKAFGAAAAGAVAGGVLRPSDAGATHGVVNGTGDGQFRPGVHGFNPDPGGVGVEGSSLTDGFGMWGRGYVGVQGTGSSAGIWGNVSTAYGTGVLGESDKGVGVEGYSHGAAGVVGGARGVDAVGVKAEDFHGYGTALQVEGPARLETASAGNIPAGQDSAFVSNRSVTGLSHITITLTGTQGKQAVRAGV
jgi:hypothetical protein